MTESNSENLEQRVLLLAPTSKDAALTQSVFDGAGIACTCCSDLSQVCHELQSGAAAIVLPEEAVVPEQVWRLTDWLFQQPPWSDLPVVILARPGADSAAVAQAMDLLGNVTVLERPTRVAAFVSAIRTALRARQRQYQIRDHLAERNRSMQAQARLAAIVSSSDDAIISKTLEGNILTWNAGAEHLFGYSANEAIGRSIMLLIPPERQDEEFSILNRLRAGEHIEHFETVRVAKGGRRIDISLTISPIRDSNGTIIGASTVARDITERKQAEQSLRDADRRKDEFLAILAHELRNPLAPVRNSLHILRMSDQQTPATRRVYEMMERQVCHMVRLVDDLMEVSRITRGKIDLRREHVEVAAIMRGAVETSQPLIDAAGLRLAVSVPPEPLTVDADPVRLTQVVANLLNNAAKYTDPGGQIWLTARPDQDHVTISVRDTGIGIAREMLPRVFELFTQIDRHANRGQGGLGIGLTLVKSLIEMHGGSVQAFSDGPGHGSEFVIALPLAATANSDYVSRKEVDSSKVLAARRVLIVDDNRDAAESLGTLLQLLGADVRVVFNGPDALKILSTHKPAVVLLDLGMPGMDGHEVARRIRQQSDLQDITLIALTGWGQEDDRHRSLLAGFDYHMIKPADLGALQSLLMSIENRPVNP